MISPDSLCLIARGFGIMRYVNIIVDCLGSATNITTTGTSSSTRDTFHFIHIYSFCRKREWVEQEKKIKRFIWQQNKKNSFETKIPNPNIWTKKLFPDQTFEDKKGSQLDAGEPIFSSMDQFVFQIFFHPRSLSKKQKSKTNPNKLPIVQEKAFGSFWENLYWSFLFYCWIHVY